MALDLKKMYIALGLDIASRNSLRYKVHTVMRGIYYVLGCISLVWRMCSHYRYTSRHDAFAWFRIESLFLFKRTYPLPELIQKQTRSAKWYHAHHHFTFKSERIIYNISYAIRAADVKGIALIYFMGMGDYFFTTPIIAALKQLYPQLPIIAYVSEIACNINSPMVATLLEQNPHVDSVQMYYGHEGSSFKNYDYTDALEKVPSQYLAMPVFYDHLKNTHHRIISLFDTFGLTLPFLLPKPLIHAPKDPSPHVTAMLQSIQRAYLKHKASGVAFLQLDVRSSQYNYPYTDSLVAGLNARGFLVISASRLSQHSDMAIELDFKSFSIIDSIVLLKLLRDNFCNTYVVSMTSVFWSISSGLNIPNLGMYHFVDEAMHNTWYPNIYVITHYDYKTLPPSRRFLASQADYELNKRSQAIFKPDFVMGCFDCLRQEIECTVPSILYGEEHRQ